MATERALYPTSVANQPAVYRHVLEQRSHDVSFTKELKLYGNDSIDSYEVEADFGLTIASHTQVGSTGVVRVFTEGGDTGHSYVLAVTATTVSGQELRHEIRVYVTGSGLATPPVQGGGGAQEDYLDSETVYGGGAA